MARGRMVTNQITRDKDVDALSSDTARLMFTWMITLADREGRIDGDPSIVKSDVFPRRRDITVEQVESYLYEFKQLGLIIWYEAKGDLFVFFPAFLKNQRNMRPEREPESEIPPPPVEAIREYIHQFADKKPEVCRQLAGFLSAEVEVEVKEKEKLKGSGSGSGGNATRNGDGSLPILEISDHTLDDQEIELLTAEDLATAFSDATGLPQPIYSNSGSVWHEDFAKLLAQGVEPEDIRLAVEELTEKKYNIVGPQSILKPAQVCMTKRLAKEIKMKRAYDPNCY